MQEQSMDCVAVSVCITYTLRRNEEMGSLLWRASSGGCRLPRRKMERSSVHRRQVQQMFTVNKFEVKCLISLFYNLVGDVTERQGVVVGLDRNAFRNILHVTFGMTDDMIMDRVFRGFDKDNDGCVSVSEWVYGLSVFLRGTLEEKMKYCFEVFDLNGDGFISKEEMVHMLKNSLLKQPSEEDPDEGIKDLVEITLKKMDHDHDGKLSFPDYEAAVREEALLLEAFGPCLPDPKSQKEFEAQVFKDPNEFGEV
ncbi:EF-hand calcium-binding domain-containing protein 1 isoform X3 [Sus scrofa]|uniref:EF-hand calcium-binding domain-containing protein 1 isoform X3 n=1 Tax=Sus scrofa TaxID=9823 RepID=UPI0006B1BCF0|nr:EF-hand calcium-binding domain-containing protein 1 isoform X3 [Sus scrofa]